MAKPKAAKRWFTDVVASAKNFHDEIGPFEGETYYEVQVVRKFKAKFDEGGKVIIPEAKN